MIITLAIFVCILPVTVEAATEGSPMLEAIFAREDFEGSDHLKATCPGTQEDVIDLLISKSLTYLSFLRLVLFRPDFPCQVNERCNDSIPLYRNQCSHCGYSAKEKQVFASISRQSIVEVYKCHYLKTNREQIYFILRKFASSLEETTTETDVYEVTTIALSCILGCVLLGVFAVLVKRCCAGNYPLVGSNLCWLNKTKTVDSVDDSVIPSQRSRRYTNEDAMGMETCFSEITTAESVTNTR